MSHDTVSPDTAVGLDGWKALVATIPPRSPQLSARWRPRLRRHRRSRRRGAGSDRRADRRRRRADRQRAPRAHAALVAERSPAGVRRRQPAGRRDPRRGGRRVGAADGGGGRGVARRRPAVDRRGLPRPDRRPADHRHRRRARVAARLEPAPVRWCARTTACADGSSPWTCRPAGPSRSTPDRRRCGRCVRSAASASWRSSRTTRPSPAGTPPGCRCWTASEASSRCTSRRGRSPPPACRPTGHASRWSRGGRAIGGSWPVASW